MLRPVIAARWTILLGRRVAAAFGLGGYPTCRWYGEVGLLPHPSGANRWWNDPANVEAASAFLREALA